MVRFKRGRVYVAKQPSLRLHIFLNRKICEEFENTLCLQSNTRTGSSYNAELPHGQRTWDP